MDKTLFTIGYGNNTPDVFLKRLTDAGVTTVYDTRRADSGSWCAQYCQGYAMFNWFDYDCWVKHHVRIEYYIASRLANNFDTLSEFNAWLSLSGEQGGKHHIEWLAELIAGENKIPCLLCCELQAYKNGEVNCHRVHVADALVKQLNEITDDKWSVVHL